MRSKIVYVATVALMASGMVLAQSNSQNNQGTMDSQSGNSTATSPQMGGHTDAQGTLPAAKEGEAQSGKASSTDPKSERPGTSGVPETPNQGASPKGETPATGVQTGQHGTTDDNGTLPAVDPATPPPTGDGAEKRIAPKSSDPNLTETPSYAKPIPSTTDRGASSPK